MNSFVRIPVILVFVFANLYDAANWMKHSLKWDQNKKNGKYQIAYEIDEASFQGDIFKRHSKIIKQAIDDINEKTIIELVPQEEVNHEEYREYFFNVHAKMAKCPTA